MVHRRWGRASAVAGVVGWLASACSSTSDRPPPLGGVYGDKDASGQPDTTTVVSQSGEAGAGQDSSLASCPTDVGGCTSLPDCAPQTNVIEVASAAPIYGGGVVADGTYWMTDYTLLTGVGGPTGATGAWFRETMTLTTLVADGGASDEGGSNDGGDGTQELQWLDSAESNTSPILSQTGTLVLDPVLAAITFEYACPVRAPFVGNYTVSGGSFVVFVDDPNLGTGQITYSKQ